MESKIEQSKDKKLQAHAMPNASHIFTESYMYEESTEALWFMLLTTKGKFLYRGDFRTPDLIFSEGFHARGTDMNLEHHVIPQKKSNKSWWHEESGFISTSKQKNRALNFPVMMEKGQEAFLYKINHQNESIDVAKTIAGELYPYEKEIAVRLKINPQEIKGAWVFEEVRDASSGEYVRRVKGSFISNPHYGSSLEVLKIPTLPELINHFEENGNQLSRETLHELGFKSRLKIWRAKGMLGDSGSGTYHLTDKFYALFRRSYSEGEWRIDKQCFTPSPKVSQAQWEALIRSKIHQRASFDNLLVKNFDFIKRGDSFHYSLEFYPARYRIIEEGCHILFDSVPNNQKRLADMAKIAEGGGRFELGRYYRQLSPVSSNAEYLSIAKDVVRMLESKQGTALGDLMVLSEEHTKIDPPRLLKSKLAQISDAWAEKIPAYLRKSVPPNTKELYGSGELTEWIKKSGRRFASVTYVNTPKCLVGLGILASVGEIAASDNKIDTTIRELNMHLGGFVGGAITGAMYTAPLGPAMQVVGTLLGGAMGAEAGKIAHNAIKALPPQSEMTLKEFLQAMDYKTSASSTSTAQAIFGEPYDTSLRPKHAASNLFNNIKYEGEKENLAVMYKEAQVYPLHVRERSKSMSVLETMRSMDPSYGQYFESTMRTAQELFGDTPSSNPLLPPHASKKLFTSIQMNDAAEDSTQVSIKAVKMELNSNESLRRHTLSLFKDASIKGQRRSNRYSSSNQASRQLAYSLEQQCSERELAQEHYYKKCYALTERVQKINEHLRSGEALQLNQPAPGVSFSDGCRIVSSAAHDLAIIANAWHLPGGRELSIIGNAAERIATGSLLICMQNAPFFATPLGWLSVVAGIATLTTLGDESDENDAIADLKRALVQLGMMLNQVLQNQQKMSDTLEVILKSVFDVEMRVKQHQTETRAALSFISTYQLQDACLAVQGDLAKTNAVSLTQDARREALSILERWLNQHLFNASLSREASGSISSTLVVETLSANPAMNTMGLILVQLQAHFGVERVPNEFVHLPPLNLFIHVAQLFLTGVLYAELPSDDGCKALCNKLVDVVQTYAKLIDYLRTDVVVWDALFAQYEHQRNMVGRALAAAGIPNQAAPISSLVTNDLKRRNLMDALDRMEERRLLLLRLIEFAFDGSAQTVLHQKVQTLESKQQVLSTHALSLHMFRSTQYYYPEAGTKNTSDMQLALRAGVDLNLGYGNGNVLNYIGCKFIRSWVYQPGYKQRLADILSYLIGHNTESQTLSTSMISNYRPSNPPDTSWWFDNYAMRMFLNCTQYGAALLLIIAGFEDPCWDYNLTGNLAQNRSHLALEVKMLISSTISPNGVLNKHKFRRAFQYYQAVMHGELVKAQTMISEGVDAHCVLWLVSLFGNWVVFEKLNVMIDWVKTVGSFTFYTISSNNGWFNMHTQNRPLINGDGYLTTEMSQSFAKYRMGSGSAVSRYIPLMVAAEHGRIDVVEGFIKLHEAGHDIGMTNTLATGDSAASLAFHQKQFEIAQRLYDLGSPLSAQQVADLNAKALPHAPLLVAPNPMIATLEQSRIETYDSLRTDSLNQMASSIQDFSAVFKLKLNAKMRLFEKAASQQDALFNQCVVFDTLVTRVQRLVAKQMLSSDLLDQLRQQQIRLYDLYRSLQKQLQEEAKTYHIEYVGREYTPKFDAIDTLEDELLDVTSLRKQFTRAFEQRVNVLAHDLGIALDDSLSLIRDLTDYLQQMPVITKDSALILFGSTGVGKTTLFNFLNGCLYQEAINEEDGNVFREKIYGIEQSEVGHEGGSKTAFPVIAQLQDKPYALIDMPGTADNRDKKDATSMSPYDLSAAIGMQCIMKRFENIKGLLVVCPDDQLTPARPPLELQEVFQQVGRMIQDKPLLAANIMLVVTKQGRRTLKQVLGRLRNIANAFIDDVAMSTFLKAFIDDPDAENRMLFMDVVSEQARESYFTRFDSLIPQPTQAYNFAEYSHRLDKLRQLLNKLDESRRQLSQEIAECQNELNLLNRLEQQERRDLSITNVKPEFLPVEANNTLDELIKFQNNLLSECDKTNHLNGLSHNVQRCEEVLEHKKEVSQNIQQLQCQEEIEADFNHRLGLLCVSQEERGAFIPRVAVRGTLFNPSRVGVMNRHQDSSQKAEFMS